MKNRKCPQAGFTLVEIMIVIAIIGLLASIAIPNFIRARAQSQTQACINNLRQIDSAVQTWALENKMASTAAVSFGNIQEYLKSAVVCPSGGSTFANSYTLSAVNAKPVCRKLPTIHILQPDTTS